MVIPCEGQATQAEMLLGATRRDGARAACEIDADARDSELVVNSMCGALADSLGSVHHNQQRNGVQLIDVADRVRHISCISNGLSFAHPGIFPASVNLCRAGQHGQVLARAPLVRLRFENALWLQRKFVPLEEPGRF